MPSTALGVLQDCGPLVRMSPAPGRGTLTKAGGGVGAVLDSSLGPQPLARSPQPERERSDNMMPLRSEKTFCRAAGEAPAQPEAVPIRSTKSRSENGDIGPGHGEAHSLALSGARLEGLPPAARRWETRRDRLPGPPLLGSLWPCPSPCPQTCKVLWGVEVSPSPCSEPR